MIDMEVLETDLDSIRDARGLNLRHKLFLFTIATYGEQCQETMASIAAKMGYSDERIVRQVCKELKFLGVVQVWGTPGKHNIYKINRAALSQLSE